MIKISKFSNTIEYNLRTTLDASGITQLQGQLASINTQLDQMASKKLLSQKEVHAAQGDIQKLGQALSSSLNPQTGLLDLNKFQKQLNGLSLSQLEQSMSKVGATGQQAFGNMIGQIGRMDTSFKSISSFADKIFNTMGNTVRWGITASIFQTIQNNLYRAVDYVQELDTSLNNIRIVTNASNEDMRNFALYANEAAQAVGASTTSFTNAAQLYAQNGFNEEDYSRLALITQKVANVTQQDTATVSEQITALMEGYHMSIDQVEKSLGGMSVVAAASAADLEELATAEQKVASTANTLGVSQEQLTAQIGTIVSVTRQAPESVGNAMRTLYARIADLQMGETLEDGTSLGELSGTLADIGINVTDAEGNLRNLGDVLEELQGKWGDLSNAQQIALGTKLAGKYQLNPFMALMENADMYQEQLEMMQTSEGALDEQNAIYMDSMAAKLQSLSTASEGFITTLFNADDFKPFIEGLTEMVNTATDFVNVLGGLQPLLTGLGSLGVKVFSNQIGQSLNNILTNYTRNKNRQTDAQAVVGLMGGIGDESQHQSSVDLIKQVMPMQGSMSAEQQEAYNATLQDTVRLENQVIEAKKQEQIAQEDLINFARLNTDIADPLTAGGKPNKDMREEQARIATNYNNTNEVLGKSINLMNAWEGKVEGVAKGSPAFVKTLDSAKKAVQEYSDSLRDAGIDVDGFIDSIESLGKTAKTPEALQQQIDVLKDFIQQLRLSEEEQAKFKRQMDTAVGNVDAAQSAKTNAEAALKAQQDANKTMGEGLITQTQLQNITAMVGGLGQLIFAWQTFQSLGGLWDNEDLTSGEKVLQTILLLSTAIPSVVSSFTDMGAGLKSLRQVIIQAANALNAMKLAETAGSLTSTAAAATSAGTAVAGAGTAAAGAAGGITTLGAALGTLLPVILPIVAALGLLGAGLYAAWQEYTKDARAAEEAAKASDRVAQATQATKAELDNLNNSIDTYHEARSAVNDLTEGTQEWRDAIAESNDEVLALLDSYPELAEYISRGKGGVLTIDESGLAALQDLQEQQVLNANAANTAAKNRASRAQTQADETELRRSIRYTDTKTVDVPGQGQQTTNYTATLSESQLSSITEMIKADGEQSVSNAQMVADALGVNVSDPVVTAITENADKIIQFNTQAEANRAAERVRSEQMAQAFLNAQEGYDQTNANNDAYVQAVTNAADEESQAYQDALSSVQGQDFNTLLKQYQDLTGDSYSEVHDDEGFLGIGKNDANDSAQFTTADGQSYTAYREDMEAALAMAQVMEDTAASWEDIQAATDKITSSSLSQSYDGLATSVINGNSEDGFNFDNLTTREMLNLADEDITADSLGITDEFAQAQGYENGEAYAEAFKQAVQEQTQDQRDLQELLSGEELSEGNQLQGMSDEDLSQFILNTIDSLSQLDQAFSQGYVNQEQYLDGLSKLASEYPELSDEVATLRKAQDKLNEVQEDESASAEEVADATMEMSDAQADLEDALLTKEWSKAREELEDYNDALASGDESSEDYQRALQKVANSLSDVSGFEVSTDWVQDNQQAINDWLNGVEGAGAKLSALLNIDYASTGIKQALTQAGVDYDALRSAIQSNSITFNMDGYADFSQVNAALGILSSYTHATSEELDLLAAYLQAMGGASLVLEKDGQVMNIEAPPAVPDMEGMDTDAANAAMSNYTAQLNAWRQEVANALDQGWAFKGIDLPDSTRSLPTSSPSGGGKSGGGGGGGGGGKGGGGGGGGGGSGKSYEPKEKDRVEDEIDRYERVNAELDTLANRYDVVADEQDRLMGFEIADNMSKQIGLIQEQIKWEREKLKIQKEEAEEYRNQLASQYGITYDAEGHISNYAAVYKRLLNNLNGLIDQYNATTTESGQEALDKQIEAAQENFDKYNDLVEKYDELVSNSILETEKEIEDFYDQIEDLQIEAFQKAVDAVDNIKDLQETLIDFNAVFTGLNSDSPFRDMITSLENLKTYWDVNTVAVDDYYDELIKRNNEAMKNASAAQKENLKYQNAVLEAARKQYGKGTFEAGGTGLFDMAMSNLNTILEQMRQFEETGTSTIFGENSGSMYEVGNDIFEQATSLLEDYEGHIDDLRDAIIDAIDEIGDKMDERLETYENINDELEHYADIIEMVQGENAYDQLNQVSQATIANNQATINELKQNIALWQDMLAAMEEGSEEWKTVNEYITDAQQELLEKTSDTIEEMLDMYERGVNDILDKWIGSTGMGDDLDWIAEEWELINRNADYYLDDVNAAYEIQKLQGKYLDLLDNANGLDIQNQITQQMAQQLGYLREKDKLSEYDVQYANAQLEILQKQIALQEAQRNKSQLQLRRDNQGNYSYVYTADENDTRAAQGDLLDAQNNAYNLSKDQMQQTQADSLSALQDARDTLEQIWTNANLTLEEKTKRTQTVIDSLKEYLAGTSEQLSESEKNIINDFIGMCDILTDENDERLQDVYEQIVNGNKDAFDQIDTRWQTSITNWLQNMEDFNAATDESFQGLIDNFEDYQGQLDELGDLAGMTFDDMSDSIQNAVDKTNDLASSTSSFISQLKNDAGTVKEYENALAEMTAKIQDAENGMRAYQEQVNQLQQNLTAKEQENANLTSQVQDLQSQIDAMKNPPSSGGGGGGGGGGANSDTAWGIAKAIWTYGGASGWGNDPIRSTKLTKAYGTDFARQVQTIINQNYRSGKLVDYGSMKYSSYNLIGYDTGGYTGKDWTASEKANGKIGLLHEKELVLNKTDTENILNAVDMVRSMVALGRNGNYNDIIRQSNNVVDMASVVQPLDDMGQTIYQVECTFPNATNVDEIQRAILTLPDIAPQYAYKS